MDKKNWFFEQRVTQAEMDEQVDGIELADRDVVSDLLGFGFLITIPEPATLVEDSPVSQFVSASKFVGYDQQGRRLTNLRSGFQGGVDQGAPPQLVDLFVDELGSATTVGAAPNEKTLSIFIEFERDLLDPRTDGNGNQVFFKQNESIKFNVVQSAEAALGTSVPPPLRTDQILLGDILRVFGQTTFANADIDQTRRQAFALSLLHGGTHIEGGSDPVPNSTPGVGGLHSAADKTKLDAITFTDVGVGALFNNQAKTFQPSNFTAPSATTLDVTGLMVGQFPGGSASVAAIVTVAPDNRVIIRDLDFDDVLDANGNKVFGRITEAASVWTLSFFSIDETSGEIAYDFTPFSGNAHQWFVQKTFTLDTLPTFDPLFSVPSDQVAGEVPDATTTTKGKVELATDGEAVANVVVQGNDSRLGAVTIEDEGSTQGLQTVLDFIGSGVTASGGDITIPGVGALQVALLTLTWSAETGAKSTGALGFTPLAAMFSANLHRGVDNDPTMSVGFAIGTGTSAKGVAHGDSYNSAANDHAVGYDEDAPVAVFGDFDDATMQGFNTNFSASTNSWEMDVTAFGASNITITPSGGVGNITGKIFILVFGS